MQWLHCNYFLDSKFIYFFQNNIDLPIPYKTLYIILIPYTKYLQSFDPQPYPTTLYIISIDLLKLNFIK